MNTAARKKSSDSHPSHPNPQKDKRESSFYRELSGIVFLAISIYALTCVLFTEGTGELGGLVRNALLGLFGPVGAFSVPAAFSVLFFFGRALRKNGVMGRKIFFTVLTVISFISAIQLIFNGIPLSSNAVDTVGDLWVKAKSGEGGGLIGGLVAIGLGVAIGRGFATVVLLAVAVISLSFALGFSGYGIWAAVGDLLCIERSPKSPKADSGKNKSKKAEKKKSSKKPDKNDPAETIAALVADSDIRANGGAAGGDVLVYSEGYDSYDGYSDGDSYGEDYGYTDTFSGEDEPVVPTVAEMADGNSSDDTVTVAEEVSDTDQAESADEAEDTNEPDEPDEPDDTAYSDPFAHSASNGKARRFGRLIGKRNVSSVSEATDEEKRISEELKKNAPQKEPEDQEDDGVQRWEKGDKYVYPPTHLLNPAPESSKISEDEIRDVSEKILGKLSSLKIKANLYGYTVGPAVTRYEIVPGEGVSVNKIMNHVSDIALSVASDGVRMAPIPGKPAIGVEVPNKTVSLVAFRTLVENPKFTKAKSKITVCIGQSISGELEVMDIDDMPHVLIAGQTKSGKSVALNCMLLSLLYRVTPDEVKLLLIDPKRVEFNVYEKIPHLVMPVIDDPTKAAAALSWAAKEMDRRYEVMRKRNARNRDEYLKKISGDPDCEVFPQIIIVIDELADLMYQVRTHVEPLISRIAAKARACGMHLVIGTQRPSVDVITGIIKSNIPARISFKVSGGTDARIIGAPGAENLIGRGDLLYHPTGKSIVRAQGAYVEEEEISRVLDFIIENNGEAQFDPDILSQLEEEENSMLKVKKRGGAADDDDCESEKRADPLLMSAIEIAVENQSISTSYLQRVLEVGYSRGAKLVDSMEKLGIVGPPNGSKPREVNMTMEEFLDWRAEQGEY